MAYRANITPELCRQLLRYEPETGKLFWLPRPREMFATVGGSKMWHTRFCGREAFTAKNGKGYHQGGIFYRIIDAHLVIWAIVNGEWPTLHIDHVNGDKADNRWRNLREVTNAENLKNKPLYKNNSSGHSGIYREGGKWSARMFANGTTIRLGNFNNLADAVKARRQAQAEMGYHPNHGRSR